MPTAKEILDIHRRRDERDKLRLAGKIDSNVDDNHLAQLGESQGWELLKLKIEKNISELLEPGMDDELVSLETIGAVTMAREFAIQALSEVVQMVESTMAAKRIEKQEAKIVPAQETL
ncbi:MAG: hypothetical protein WC823_00200 [Parcubacteria group bacterium]|jgi:hypothetical protein